MEDPSGERQEGREVKSDGWWVVLGFVLTVGAALLFYGTIYVLIF